MFHRTNDPDAGMTNPLGNSHAQWPVLMVPKCVLLIQLVGDVDLLLHAVTTTVLPAGAL
jgi:hypothetical protein